MSLETDCTPIAEGQSSPAQRYSAALAPYGAYRYARAATGRMAGPLPA